MVSGRNWFVLQQDFGAPFAGSPPVAFDIKDDGLGANRFVMDVCHDGCPATTTAWAGPAIEAGHWYHFVVHKVFSTADDTGLVEIWLDGVPQTFVDGSMSYHTRTLHANCTCLSTNGYRFYLNNYHADALSLDPVTVYLDGASIGTSREDVDTGASDPSDSPDQSDSPPPSDPPDQSDAPPPSDAPAPAATPEASDPPAPAATPGRRTRRPPRPRRRRRTRRPPRPHPSRRTRRPLPPRTGGTTAPEQGAGQAAASRHPGRDVPLTGRGTPGRSSSPARAAGVPRCCCSGRCSPSPR